MIYTEKVKLLVPFFEDEVEIGTVNKEYTIQREDLILHLLDNEVSIKNWSLSTHGDILTKYFEIL